MNIFDPVLVPHYPVSQFAPSAPPGVAPKSSPLLPAPIPVPRETYPPLEFAAITITLASAAAIGSNMVDVQNGGMSRANAVANGIAKGTAASIILSLTDKKNLLDIGIVAATLAGAGYLIDKMMKKRPEASCDSGEGETAHL